MIDQKTTHILNLPASRELDIIVAENVIGYKRIYVGGVETDTHVLPIGNYWLTTIPSYSTCIKDAWQLLLDLFDRYEHTGITLQAPCYHHNEKYWYCRLEGYTPKKLINAGSYRIIADTAPLAICRLALASIEIEKELNATQYKI